MDGELEEGAERMGRRVWKWNMQFHGLGGQCEIRNALLMNAMSVTLLRYSNLSIRSRESPHSYLISKDSNNAASFLLGNRTNKMKHEKFCCRARSMDQLHPHRGMRKCPYYAK